MKPLMIGIAGGTGSGKSTFTDRLRETFGDDIAVIYHDNYYRRNDGISIADRESINYDHPDSLETELLVEHLIKLRSGIAINSPIYDFTVHNRLDRTERIEPKRIIIVEGILVLADKRLRDLFDIKIYVEADADERILRRVVRDMKERGRDIEGIVRQYLTTVKPMHNMFVEPSRAKADFVINGGMNPVALDLMVTKIRNQLADSESAGGPRID
jgi:uridine kinase